MTPHKELEIFISYMVYIFLKRIYDLYISVKYPNEEIVTNASDKTMIYLRELFNVISIIWISYMIICFKLNPLMKGFLYIIWLNVIYYFLFEREFVYLFINKEKTNNNVMDFLKEKGSVAVNTLFLITYLYVIYKLFLTAYY